MKIFLHLILSIKMKSSRKTWKLLMSLVNSWKSNSNQNQAKRERRLQFQIQKAKVNPARELAKVSPTKERASQRSSQNQKVHRDTQWDQELRAQDMLPWMPRKPWTVGQTAEEGARATEEGARKRCTRTKDLMRSKSAVPDESKVLSLQHRTAEAKTWETQRSSHMKMIRMTTPSPTITYGLLLETRTAETHKS